MPSGSNEEVACKDGATNGDLQQPFTAPFDGGSCNGFARYPVTAYLYLDGALTSKIRVERPELTSFALVLPYLTAGDHTLAFKARS